MTKAVVEALLVKAREARNSTFLSWDVSVRFPAIFPEPVRYRRDVPSVIMAPLFVNVPPMVTRRPETLSVPAWMVRADVEAFPDKVFVPAARNSTLLKSSDAPVISPERVGVPEK